MFHRATTIGLVDQAPPMRYAPDGTPATNFWAAICQVVSKEQVAVCPQGWEESQTARNWELTTWFRISWWRNLAMAVTQNLEKGSQVSAVEGELRGDASNGSQNPRIWQGNDGEHRAGYETTARTATLVGSGCRLCIRRACFDNRGLSPAFHQLADDSLQGTPSSG